MKKLIFLSLLLIAFVVPGNAQLLYNGTYTTLTVDTMLVAGSTDSGTDFFTNAGYDEIWIELASAIASTTLFKTYRITYPMKDVQKLKAYMEGDDSTVYVIVYGKAGESLQVPIETTGIGTVAYTIDNGATAGYLVRFRGFYK